MRTSKSVKNSAYGLAYFFINFILSFISRYYFIKGFGADYLGLTTVVINIIGIINVMELGVSSAIGYSLYGLLNEKKYTEINQLIVLIKGTYRLIGVLVIFIGVAITPFFQYIFKSNINTSDIYITYFIYVFLTVLSYFCTYKQVLVISDQKTYVITKYRGIAFLFKSIMQIIVSVVFKNFYMWIAIELIVNFLSFILINRGIDRKYFWLNDRTSKSYWELLKEEKKLLVNIKNIVFHRISGVITLQTDTIVLSFVGMAKDIAIYSNYLLLSSGIISLIFNVYSGLIASIGNLISEGDHKKNLVIFRQLFAFEFFLGVCISFTFYKIINPFIMIWLGKSYLLENKIVLIVSMNLFIQLTRRTIEFFKEGYGIFYDIYAPITQATINLGLSVFISIKFGIIGVYLGTLISSLPIVICWKPYLLFKKGFGISPKIFFVYFIKLSGFGIISILFSNYLYNQFFYKYVYSVIGIIFISLTTFLTISTIYFTLMIRDKYFKKFISIIFAYFIKSKFIIIFKRERISVNEIDAK